MAEEELKAIEKWRKLYPELSDEELLEVNKNMLRYELLLWEIVNRQEEPGSDTD